MTSTPEMQRRARIKRKKYNAKSKLQKIKEAIENKEPIDSICKRLIVEPLTVQKLELQKRGLRFLKAKIRGARHQKGRK